MVLDCLIPPGGTLDAGLGAQVRDIMITAQIIASPTLGAATPNGLNVVCPFADLAVCAGAD